MNAHDVYTYIAMAVLTVLVLILFFFTALPYSERNDRIARNVAAGVALGATLLSVYYLVFNPNHAGLL